MNKIKRRTVVGAQLGERSLLMPEVRSSNPVISKILWWKNLLLTVEKAEKKYRGRKIISYGETHFVTHAIQCALLVSYLLWVKYLLNAKTQF